jgi:pimeloyl-ACP methyl ester carboxylesterase
MLLALQCAFLSTISMMLGLLRWPSVHWRLAEVYVTADPAQGRVLGAVFDGLNTHRGNYLGEFVGELSFNAFFVQSGWALRRQNPLLISEWKRQAASLPVPSLLRCLEALMHRDSLLPRLTEITVPTLVLVGPEDRSLPPPLSRRIHDGLRHSTFALIPAAGHLSSLERPAPVTDAILRFLSTHAH